MADVDRFDLVIRNGTIVDGSGGMPFVADVGICGGTIAAIAPALGEGREEIDAGGCIVTPGFVDVHTHYDGQAIWSSRLSPSSSHGVTTAVMGNCGVGFAPCRAADRDLLVSAMEGVEDIPEVVTTEGLTWEWETFPEFLAAVETRPHDIDLAVYLPHSALRVYVMGARGADREPATQADIARMAELTREAMAAGAMGFATSNFDVHRRGDGEHIPTFGADQDELLAIARAIRDSGGGVFQMIAQTIEDDRRSRAALDVIERVAEETGVTVTFSLSQSDRAPRRVRAIAEEVREINRAGRGRIKPQIFPRPIGILVGLSVTTNPFAYHPSYMAIAHLPLAERVAELRKAEVRARILGEAPGDPTLPILLTARRFHRMFRMTDIPDYEPSLADSVTEQAKARGMTPEAVAYDWLLEDEGKAILFIAAANYSDGNLDLAIDMVEHPDTVVALGDGGAHYGLICDSSYPTFVLTHLCRDRDGRRISLPEAVRVLTSKPAALIGLEDRGLLRPGLKADINVIEFDALRLNKPFVTQDLPADGRRISQSADGYRATVVSGQVISRDDRPTGRLPGRLVRGAQRAARPLDRDRPSRTEAIVPLVRRASRDDGRRHRCRRRDRL